jgi:dienelactone hydrolase
MPNRWLLALLAFALIAPSHAAVVFKEVAYKDGEATLKGYIAYDGAMKQKRPGLLVVHEWWGVTEHVKSIARELAAKGYTAMVVDMYGKVADEPKLAGELMKGVMGEPAVMKSRFDAAKSVLVSHPTVDPKRLGAIGYSMGSSVVLNMARQGEELAGVASVYGALATKTPAQPGVMKSRVLVLHVPGDPYARPEDVEAFKKEMAAARVNYRWVEYPGAKHGFANPDATGNGKKYNMPIAYDAATDRKSKAEMLKFFSGIFDRR